MLICINETQSAHGEEEGENYKPILKDQAFMSILGWARGSVVLRWIEPREKGWRRIEAS